MCKRNEESVNFFLCCEVTCDIWNVFLSRFGLSLVMLKQVVDLYAWFGLLAALGAHLCGRWCLCAFCGVYRGKERL